MKGRRILSFHYYCWALLALGFWPTVTNAQAPSDSAALECVRGSVDYEWERWNYYELLGLERPPDIQTTLDNKGIRKAYRKQAQLWHPDKQGRSASGSSSSSTTTTNQNTKGSNNAVNESTARFARIAQAYEVLSDDWKRKEYDLFLRYCDNLQEEEILQRKASSSSVYRKHWSNLFSNFGDPFRVFEEFLFGKDDQDEDLDDWFFDMPPARPNGPPVRITKHQDVFRDGFGADIVRVSQTEEYAPEPNTNTNTNKKGRRYYYRIVSQDFSKRYDTYTGTAALEPLTQPYLREEGYRKEDASSTNNGHTANEFPRQSFLFPGEVLTPNSAHLVSPNRRYYAGLSPDCELLVMADDAFERDDKVIWSSESLQSHNRYGQRGRGDGAAGDYCFATLRGPHLVVAMGPPELPRRILWYSEAADELEGEDNPNYGIFQSSYSPTTPSTYVTQLDDDGSLVVYKVWAPTPHYQDLPLSARAWIVTRNFLMGTTRDDQYDRLLLFGGNDATHAMLSTTTFKRCVFATGPLGCYRLARRLYQLSLDIYYTLRGLVAKMDNMFDAWFDLILEEDNYLRALKESTSGLGSQVMSKSARIVRKVLELVMLRGDK